jgi:Flp pilus assembly pilin Flp
MDGVGGIMGHASLGMVRARKGQSLVEYALILFLVALAAVAGLGLFGAELMKLYNFIVSRLPAASA